MNGSCKECSRFQTEEQEVVDESDSVRVDT
jgi:hypothetical protein